jgi:NitT/TauT family transport system permease protein
VIRRLLQGTIGLVALLVLWQLAGDRGWLGRSFAPPSRVLDTLRDPTKSDLLQRAFRATSSTALRGFVIGVVLALAVAAISQLLPMLRPGLDRLAAVLQALPIIALAPLFIVTVGRDGTPVAISAIAACFPMFVAATSAFGAARTIHLDVVHVLGSTALQQFGRVRVPASIPGLTEGLRLAAPAAVLGAILGEWFGAPRGLGILMVNAMQNYQVGVLWTAALLGALLSMVAFGMLSLLAFAAHRRFEP